MTAIAVAPTLQRPSHRRVDRHAGERNRSTDIFIVLSLLVIVGIVAGINLAHYPSMQDDEGTYTAQAWAIQHGRLAPYTYWYDHPPLGWFQIGLLSWIPQGLHLGGAQSIASTRFVMLFALLIDTPLIYFIGSRLQLSAPFATAGVLLWCLSPLTIFEGRQVYLDNVALPWVLLSILLVLSPRRALWHYAGAGAAIGIALLTKETTALLLPVPAYLLLQRSVPPLRAMAVAAFSACFCMVVVTYPIFAVLRGELLPGRDHVSLWTALAFQLGNRQSSGSIFDPLSNKRQTIAVWVGHDRYLLIAGLIACILVMKRRELRPLCLGIALGLVPLIKTGYLPVMFVIVYLPLLAIVIAGLADTIWTWAVRLSENRRRPAVGSALAAYGVVLALIGPSWAKSDHHEMTVDATAMQRAIASWIETNVPHTDSVLVDDSYWLDLTQHGFSSDGWHGPIWYYKLDLDPVAEKQNLPDGWKNVDYVIYNDAIRLQIEGTNSPISAAAVSHGKVVATFGTGGDPVKILEVMNGEHNPAAFSP